MPIRIADNLPAINALRHENIFCISSSEADHQDIRPLRVLLLNLMPKKIETEVHLMRMLANSPLQMDVELMRINDRPSKNTPIEHMETFYKSFEQVKDQKYDGMIVTGAPLGQTPFEDVTFWEDMKTILDWTQTNVTSVMFLCWGVQAAMYHLYGVEKHVLPKKISGVYPHKLVKPLSPIVRGFDDIFDAPHSRYAEVRTQDVEAHLNSRLSQYRILPVPIYSREKMAGSYLSQAIPSTSLYALKMNMIEISNRVLQPQSLKTIFQMTIRPKAQSSHGRATAIYCSLTGLIIMSIS